MVYLLPEGDLLLSRMEQDCALPSSQERGVASPILLSAMEIVLPLLSYFSWDRGLRLFNSEWKGTLDVHRGLHSEGIFKVSVERVFFVEITTVFSGIVAFH